MSIKAARATVAFPMAAADANEDLLTIEEAARRLGIKPWTLRRMAQRREIPSIKYSKLRRFEPAALREYIAKHRVG